MSKEITVLLFKGHYERSESRRILEAYSDRLGEWADIEWITYHDRYSKDEYEDSVHEAVRLGLDVIRNSSKPVFTAGYAQGADAAAYLHALVNRNSHNTFGHDLSGCSVKHSFLIADPCRSSDAQILNGPVGGWGVRGQRRVGAYSFGVVNPGDPVAAYGSGPLRNFADFKDVFGDPERVEKIRAMVEEKRATPWWKMGNPVHWFRNWLNMLGWLNNYFSGFHTNQYLDKQYVRQLTDFTNKKASELLTITP